MKIELGARHGARSLTSRRTLSSPLPHSHGTRRKSTTSSPSASSAAPAGGSGQRQPQVGQTLSPGVGDVSSSSSDAMPPRGGRADSHSEASSSASAPTSTSTSSPFSWLTANPALSRKLLAASDAAALEDLLPSSPSLTEAECMSLIAAALDKGNVQLALSVHGAMRARRPTVLSSQSFEAGFAWPSASIQTTCVLVLGLCRQVAIPEAVRAVTDVRVPVPRSEEVGFGKVISSPLAPGRTLTVVQPQEGFKLVADAYSKYEYEVFSGRVVTCSSEALPSQANNPLFMLARAVGFQRSPPPAAVHTLTAQAPDGTSRTFRFATETSGVPAQVGERVTLIAAPFKNSAKGRRAIFSASPPGRRPGEAMQATNHKTGVVTALLAPPPSSGAAPAFPAWVLPAAVLLAGGDAASSLIDPALPAMIALGASAAVGSVVAGTTVVVPRLKQLSDRDVSLEYMRQQLLGQYALLAAKSDDVGQEANEDIRVLSKLWQLQSKMEAIGRTASAYEARISRIATARQNIEERLKKKLELLDGYARVMNMIEIEVEMDIEVPAAELEGIEMQLARLKELEGLQDDWRVQAEARDEGDIIFSSMQSPWAATAIAIGFDCRSSDASPRPAYQRSPTAAPVRSTLSAMLRSSSSVSATSTTASADEQGEVSSGQQRHPPNDGESPSSSLPIDIPQTTYYRDSKQEEERCRLQAARAAHRAKVEQEGAMRTRA